MTGVMEEWCALVATPGRRLVEGEAAEPCVEDPAAVLALLPPVGGVLEPEDGGATGPATVCEPGAEAVVLLTSTVSMRCTTPLSICTSG